MLLFLRELKKGKNIFLVLSLMILLIFPLYCHIYHMILYYILIVLGCIPLTVLRIMKSDFLEMRFYRKWEKKRKKGRLNNFFSESLRILLLEIVTVFGSQFIANGRTPGSILSVLPINSSIGLMLFAIILAAIAGSFAWYENEKRFNKIHSIIEEDKK